MKKALIFLIVLFTACSQSKKEKISAQAEINELPALTLTMSGGEKVMVNSMSGNTVLIFFKPDCDHCQREAEAIRTQLGEFKNYSLYFIACNPWNEITPFAEKYRLTGYQNVLFAQADAAELFRVMGSIGTPSLFIYSSEKRLVKKFNGESDVTEIVKFL